jgi:hypothetical protein
LRRIGETVPDAFQGRTIDAVGLRDGGEGAESEDQSFGVFARCDAAVHDGAENQLTVAHT